MSTLVNPDFKKELTAFGMASEWNECFHCGNCTAICPLTEQGFLFPRDEIRSVQMGLRKKLEQKPEPWLCYYCGECTDTCPRNANPGELMMTLRRYLTSVYDWTGLSGALYKSFLRHIAVIIFLFLAVIGSFLIFADFNIAASENGIVRLNDFAPAGLISHIDHILLLTLSFFLLTNMINMFIKVIIRDKSVNIPVYLYLTEAFNAIIHFFTQKRFAKCDRKIIYWIGHWFIMSGYVTMFVMIIFFLDWFQTDEIHPVTHPQRWLGYYATAGFLFGTIYFMIGRIRKKEQIFKYSHHSDWIFIVLLFLIAVTGILIHIFRLNGMAAATNYTYVIHLAVEVPMVVTFVAFSKWSHLAYRPLAIYFSNLKKAAIARQEKLNSKNRAWKKKELVYMSAGAART